MENTDAPGVRGEPGERRASGRGRDSPDTHFFFADALGNVIECERFNRKMTMSFMQSKVLLLVLSNSLLVPSLSITPDKSLTTFGSASALWFD